MYFEFIVGILMKREKKRVRLNQPSRIVLKRMWLDVFSVFNGKNGIAIHGLVKHATDYSLPHTHSIRNYN